MSTPTRSPRNHLARNSKNAKGPLSPLIRASTYDELHGTGRRRQSEFSTQPFMAAKREEFIRLPYMAHDGADHERRVPMFKMPDEPLKPKAAYRLIKDEMNLDGNPVLNLASFVQTRMDPECDQLMMENLGKNFIDAAEYPQSTLIEERCVTMLRDVFNADKRSLAGETAEMDPSRPASKKYGMSTIGSSEAIHLAALNMRWMWQREQPDRYPDILDDGDDLGRTRPGRAGIRPNLIFPDVAHVCWHKFCRYFDVEMRVVPISADRTCLDVAKAIELCDDRTIGVVAILGSTYTGEFDDVDLLNTKLDEVNSKNGWRIPIHVDAASGGLVSAFLFPAYRFDFRLKWVRSINMSGHKYGLAYPGIGWLVFNSTEDIHKGLVFEVDYLGEPELTLTLNFSKGASSVLSQYYQFLRLGKKGYTTVFKECMSTARFLERALREWKTTDGGHMFKIYSKCCTKVAKGRMQATLPVVVFSLMNCPFDESDLVMKLKERGWILPACALPLPEDDPEVTVVRIVVRETLSEKLSDILLWDIHRAVEALCTDYATRPRVVQRASALERPMFTRRGSVC
eukprot:92934_1